MDPWDSGYDQNEFTNASNVSDVDTEPERLDLEPGEPSQISGLNRSGEPTSRSDVFQEDSDSESECLLLESIFLKPMPKSIKQNKLSLWQLSLQWSRLGAK